MRSSAAKQAREAQPVVCVARMPILHSGERCVCSPKAARCVCSDVTNASSQHVQATQLQRSA